MTKYSAVLLLGIAASGCSSEDDRVADCTFAGGFNEIAAAPETGCVNCSVADLDLAADGYLDSAARVTVGASSTSSGMAIRIKARDPAFAYPADRQVTLFWTHPDGGWCDERRFFLDGQVLAPGNAAPGPACTSSGFATSGSTTTGAPGSFDEVEIVISSNEASGSTQLQIREICADF